MSLISSRVSEGQARATFRLVGFLFALEFVSGILQGYYVPLVSDIVKHLGITDADYNWFDAAQLLVAALVVPILAKLGDLFGHKRILLISTILTALASWGLVLSHDFTSYLVAFAFQGFYVVWLPLEVALIFDKGRRSSTAASQTRRAAGFLVVALEAGAIAGALAGSAVFGAFDSRVAPTLMVPAIAVTVVFFAILFGVPESEPVKGRSLDGGGFALLAVSLLLITGSLTFLRTTGPDTWWVWVPLIVGAAMLVPFARYERRRPDPAIDLRVFSRPTMWPILLTAGLFGISVLGAQAPLSTFAGTDRDTVGYGLGLASSLRSLVIGGYLVSMIVGAVLYPILARRRSPRVALIVAAFFVAVGYLLFLPLHDTTIEVVINMVIAGVGSGALVAALPAAAAAAAPRGQTGIAAGLTNTTKTIGGSFAAAIFGLVLVTGATSTAGTAASLSGYIAVWTICGVGALVAAVLLFLVPKTAFGDADLATVEASAPRG